MNREPLTRLFIGYIDTHLLVKSSVSLIAFIRRLIRQSNLTVQLLLIETKVRPINLRAISKCQIIEWPVLSDGERVKLLILGRWIERTGR